MENIRLIFLLSVYLHTCYLTFIVLILLPIFLIIILLRINFMTVRSIIDDCIEFWNFKKLKKLEKQEKDKRNPLE